MEKKNLCTFLFIVHFTSDSAGRARTGVKITGTTVHPGLKIVRGVASKMCPVSYPFALNAGNHCCKAIFHPSTPDVSLDIYDPLEKCSFGQYIPCPEKEAKCKSDFSQEVRVSCPISHPYPIGNGAHCCFTFHKASNGIIKISDPYQECAQEKRIACPGLPAKRCRFDKAPTRPCPGTYPYAYAQGCCVSNTTTNAAKCGDSLTEDAPKECCADPLPVLGCSLKLENCQSTNPCLTADWTIVESLSDPTWDLTYYLYEFMLKDDAANCDDLKTYSLSKDPGANKAFVVGNACPASVEPRLKFVESIFFRNTRNRIQDRSTKKLDIYISETYADDYEKVASVSFPDARHLACNDPQYEQTATVERLAARIKIVYVEYYGKGPGLEYMKVNLRDE